MKKTIALILLSFGLQSQTLIKFKQLEKSSPAGTGSVVVTDANGILSYTNNFPVSVLSNAWGITGNAIATNTNFIGTTTNTSFYLKTYTFTPVKIDSLGGVSVYCPTPFNVYPLTIRSTTAGNSYIRLYGTTNSGVLFTNSTTATDGRLAMNTATTGAGLNDLFIGFSSNPVSANQAWTTDGNTEIRTKLRIGSLTTPTAALDVTGTMSISSTSTLTGIQNNGSFITNTTGSVGTTFTVGGAMNALSTLSVGSTCTVNGAMNASSTLSVSSTATIAGNLTVSSGSIYGTTSANFISLDNSVGSKLAYNTNNLWYVGNQNSGVNLNGITSQAWNTTGSALTGSFSLTGRLKEAQGTDVASATGSISLQSDGNVFELTGTSAITLIETSGWSNGSEITLLFTSTASLTDGTANSGTLSGFELAGNVNFTGSADDMVTLVLCELGGLRRWREKCRSVN